ncbi:MAG: MarC family protein [Flavobacteriales bacterium]
MFSSIIAFLVMLNPFALFLYLLPIIKELNLRSFAVVLFKASITALVILFLFFFFGKSIFNNIFHIYFDSFRIFGGIILFTYAFMFIVNGKKAFITLKEDLNKLASEIAVPFIIGAGTISLAVLLGKDYEILKGSTIIVIVLIVNYAIIYTLAVLRHFLYKKQMQTIFDNNMEFLLRVSGFFIGAIGVDMVVKGIENLTGG